MNPPDTAVLETTIRIAPDADEMLRSEGDKRAPRSLGADGLSDLVGMKVLQMEEPSEHRHSVREIEEALSRIKQLCGLVSMCSCCNRITDDLDHWREIRWLSAEQREARCRHTICPDCYETVVKPEVELVYAYLHGLCAKRDSRTGEAGAHAAQ